MEIRISGIGGQGQVLAGAMLADALGAAGLRVAFTRSYEPTSRGGLSRADVVASPREIDYPLVTTLDRLVVLDQLAAAASDAELAAKTLVLVDAERVGEPPRGVCRVLALPFAARARAAGNARAANIVALGALAASGVCTLEVLAAAVAARSEPRFRESNHTALQAGHELAVETGLTASAEPASNAHG